MSGQPYDYRMQYVDPVATMQAAALNSQAMQKNSQVLEQNRIAAEQKAADDAENNKLFSDFMETGNPKSKERLILKNGTIGKAILERDKLKGEEFAQNKVKDLQGISSALSLSRPDVAKGVIDNRIAALTNSGNPDPNEISVWTSAKKAIESGDPDQITQVHRMADLNLGWYNKDAAQGAGYVGDEQRKQDLQPFAQSKVQGESEKVKAEAEIAKQNALDQAEKNRTEIALKKAQAEGVIDETSARQVTAEIAAKKLEIAQSKDRREQAIANQTKLGNPVAKLDTTQKKAIGDAVQQSYESLTNANTADALAKELSLSNNSGGWINGMKLKAYELVGNDTSEVAVAKQIQRIILNGMLQNLPPGPATDKDIELVAKGYPSFSSSDKAKADFLTSYAKVQRNISQANDMKAAWISANGHLGTLTRDIEFDGKTYAAGTTFNQAVRRTRK